MKKSFDAETIFNYGKYSRIPLFFFRKKQLEDLSSKELDALSFIQGHTINESSLHRFHNRRIFLMTVLRAPVSLTRSAYNHYKNEMQRIGNPVVTTESFLESRRDNIMCRTIIESWPSLVRNASDSLANQALSVLEHFGGIFLTPYIDEDVRELGVLFGGEHAQVERKRVAESKHTLDISDEEIIERNREDDILYKAMEQQRKTQGALNEKYATFPPSDFSEEEDIFSAYTELAKVLCDQLRGESALLQLKRDKKNKDATYIDIPTFTPIMQDAWEEKAKTLTPQQHTITTELTQHWLRYNRLPHPIYMQLVRCKRLVWGLGRRIKAQMLRSA